METWVARTLGRVAVPVGTVRWKNVLVEFDGLGREGAS